MLYQSGEFIKALNFVLEIIVENIFSNWTLFTILANAHHSYDCVGLGYFGLSEFDYDYGRS